MAVPALAAVAVMAVGMAEGVLASSFAVSGSAFQVSSGRLSSNGLASFVEVDRSADGEGHPVALLGIGDATLSDICQSAQVPTPLGPVVFKLTAGGRAGAVRVSQLVLDSEDLTGDASFGRAQIGRDASTLDTVPGVQGRPGQFGLQASEVSVSGVRSHSRSATGGDFKLKGLALNVSLDGKACF
ncbi:cholesterol esterase [Streptomyces rectiverticillatus]|nr:cholesterol esterase [Streptomyces rectiverticillatus]